MYFKCISHLSISYFLSSLSLPPLPNGQNTMCCLPQVLLDLQLRDVSHLCLYQVIMIVVNVMMRMLIMAICWKWLFSLSKYNMLAADDTICCLPQVLILDRRLRNWSYLSLFQVVMIMVVVISMLVMEIKMIMMMMMTVMKNTSGN